MSRRFNLTTPIKRKDNEKTFWHRLGTMWENDDGSFNLVFDSFPVNTEDGKVKIRAFDASDGKKF